MSGFNLRDKSLGSPYLFFPILLALTFWALIGLLLSTIYKSQLDQVHRALKADSINARETVLRHLRGNRDYLPVARQRYGSRPAEGKIVPRASL